MKAIRVGRSSPMKGKHHSELTKKIMSEKMSGKNHPQFGRTGMKAANWKGGCFTHDGYIYHYRSPQSVNRTGPVYIPEHRIVGEKVLGRPLGKNEIVHHINFDPKDNRNANLLICTKQYHGWIHKQYQIRDKKAAETMIQMAKVFLSAANGKGDVS